MDVYQPNSVRFDSFLVTKELSQLALVQEMLLESQVMENLKTSLLSTQIKTA